MLSFFSTRNSKLAICLATMGVDFSLVSPITKSEKVNYRGEKEIVVTFCFQQTGTWWDYARQHSAPVKAQDVADQFTVGTTCEQLDKRVVDEIALVKKAVLDKSAFALMLKSKDPQVSSVAIAVAENASFISSAVKASQLQSIVKLRGGTLYAPSDRIGDAEKVFSCFR